jgi:putative cell wall-binding protein
MTAIDVDAKNPSYSSADGILFSNNKNELIQYPGGKEGAYTIPDSVTSIGDWAFSGCHSLTSVSIGNSVTSIGKYAFYSCSSLTNVTIPDNVTSIGEEAFSGCGLTSVTIGNGVRGIGDRAFSGCHSLTSVSIGNSVTSIGVGAFSGCRSLTSVIIPDSVTSIGKYAFSHCSSLTSVAIGNSVTSIRDEAFYWCDNLISVTIPESVTSISDNAFSYSNKVVIYGIPGSYAETYARNNGIPFKPYEEPPAVDKTQLEALITETEQLKSGDYTAESWADFTEALQAAKAVSAKTGVTQTEVDNAYAALSAAKGQLVTMDEKAAKEVDDEIAAIGTVTLESKAAIASARSAYNALTQERKDLVKNLGALQAAEAAYAALVAEKDEELVTPAAEAIDGTAALSVTEPEMATAVSKAIEYECSYITIKPQIVGEASKVTVELPKASLISMASNTEADLRVETTVGTVSIPRKVIPSLTAQAEGKSITVILESVDKEKTLNKKQKKAVGDKPVYEIAIKSGENRISSFEGCGITIILPYTLKEGETTDDVKVWYLNDAGELEQIACGYDAESGLASFTTEHLSYFTIGVEKNDGGEVKRIAGGNRYDTSAKTALDAYPGGAETVIIARGDDQGNFADALAASYLAGVEKAPILLTSPGSLPQEIEDAVKKLGAKKAYVLGGELAVSQRVESKLNSLGLETERIIGNNRYATAAAIAARGGKAETAIVVSGYAPADSLVAGPLAFSNRYPILLVDKNSVPAETKKAIADLGIKNIIVIGGENVVSKAVYSELNAKKRYAGQSRVATSLVVAEKSFAEAKDFSIVSYLKLADAVGAAVCGNPIIYVKDNISDVKNYLTGAARTNTNFTIYGGALAVNSTVENELKKLLQ